MTGGRDPRAGRWIRRTPVGVLTAFACACLVAWMTAQYRHDYVWTPEQREYLGVYIKSGLKASTGISHPKHARIYRLLQTDIYGGQSPMDLSLLPLLVGSVVVALGLVFAIRFDRSRASERRLGRHLQGTKRLPVNAFNRLCRFRRGMTIRVVR